MIKNIIFDLGGVIINGHHYYVLNDLNISEEVKKEIEDKFFNEVTKLDYKEGTIQECLNNSGLELDDYTKDYILHYYKHRKYNQDVIDLKNELSKNYNIYILSNMNMEVINYLESIGLFENTTGRIISQPYKTIKPDKEIYEILLNKYNLKPEECIFIDDTPENVETAINLGMDGFIYKENTKELINYLKEKGIIL